VKLSNDHFQSNQKSGSKENFSQTIDIYQKHEILKLESLIFQLNYLEILEEET